MAFVKRLGYFLVGLSIGIVFLTFFFKKKSDETGVYFCYLPNCRVLKDLRSKPLHYSDQIQKQLKNKEIDSLDIVLFLKDGEVDFSKSDTKSTPCKTYYIQGNLKQKEAFLTVINCVNKVQVKNIAY